MHGSNQEVGAAVARGLIAQHGEDEGLAAEGLADGAEHVQGGLSFDSSHQGPAGLGDPTEGHEQPTGRRATDDGGREAAEEQRRGAPLADAALGIDADGVEAQSPCAQQVWGDPDVPKRLEAARRDPLGADEDQRGGGARGAAIRQGAGQAFDGLFGAPGGHAEHFTAASGPDDARGGRLIFDLSALGHDASAGRDHQGQARNGGGKLPGERRPVLGQGAAGEDQGAGGALYARASSRELPSRARGASGLDHETRRSRHGGSRYLTAAAGARGASRLSLSGGFR